MHQDVQHLCTGRSTWKACCNSKLWRRAIPQSWKIDFNKCVSKFALRYWVMLSFSLSPFASLFTDVKAYSYSSDFFQPLCCQLRSHGDHGCSLWTPAARHEQTCGSNRRSSAGTVRLPTGFTGESHHHPRKNGWPLQPKQSSRFSAVQRHEVRWASV